MVEFGRILVVIGLAIAFSGIVILVAAKIFPSLGNMPGTFTFEGENFKIVFPLGMMILISLLGTILLNVVFRIFR